MKFFTPGPGQLFPTVKSNINRAIENNILSISHRSLEFKDIYQQTSDNIKKLLMIPDEYYILFVSSATEAMERILQSTVSDKSYHLVCGAFSNRAYQIARNLSLKSEYFEYDFKNIDTLADNTIPKDFEQIWVTQTETSTGLSISNQVITNLNNKNPDKLLVVDAVSGLPYVDLEYSKIDAAFFSVQKGFGLPAGLGVIIASPRLIKHSEKLFHDKQFNNSYHNLWNIFQKAQKRQTIETPNVLNIYLLGKICKNMSKIGIDVIRKETEDKAQMIINKVTEHPEFNMAISNDNCLAKTVLVINYYKNVKSLHQKLLKANIIVGNGYGDNKDSQIRIANFPTHSINDFKQLADVLFSN